MHSFPALGPNGSLHLNVEPIPQFCMLLEYVLNRRVVDLGGEGCIDGVNL